MLLLRCPDAFKKVGLLAWGVALCLMQNACQKEIDIPKSDPALVQRAMDLQKKVYALELKNQELRDAAGQADAFHRQLAENVTEFEQAKLERDKIKTDFESLQRDYDELIKQLEPINKLLASYEAKLRQNLEGEILGNVELRDGRVLVSAIVEKVEADWVSLKHSNGMTNVNFNLLPDYLQRIFAFRPSMVSTDSLIAQKPIIAASTLPQFRPDDAAKAMLESMATQREDARLVQQKTYRNEIEKLTDEIARGKAHIKNLAAEKSAKRSEMNRSGRIRMSEIDKQKAMDAFDSKIRTTQREIMSREARLYALQSMLDPPSPDDNK